MFSVALGHDVESGQEVRLGDIERRSGLYLLGKMGMGKSALCVNIARQDIENGHGIFFLDPHGEAINELLRTGDYFSLQLLGALFDVEDEEYSFGINLLHCGNVASIRQRNDTYTRAYNVFYKIWEDQWGPWLQLFLQNILRAFIENQDYTLADVPMFLNPQNVDFRNHIISNIKYNPAVADFWRHEFFQRRESAQQERVDAALTRINTLLTDDYVRHIVGQKQTTLDFEMLLTLPNILLFKLSANLAEDAKKFIGSILVSELLHAVRNRPEGEREQFCLFIDEFQNFSGHDDMSLMITEGRKFKLASTFLHVERFGQLANQQKLMGATLATANKVFLQLIVPDAQESAPEFAKRVEATEERREAELILSPHPVEDIWDRGHPHKAIMGLREKCFWIVDLLRSNPSAKYFVFDSSRLSPEFLRYNPIDFAVEDFDDWQYYRVSADMLKQGIAVLNQFFYNWMSGKYDPNVVATSEQIELITQIIENIGPLFGFLPMLRPYIPTENRERLLYLINETIRKHHAEDRRDKVAAKRAEIQYLKDHGIRLVETWHIDSRGERRRGWDSYSGVDQFLPAGEKSKLMHAQDEHLKSLAQQILDLERSQPRFHTDIPSRELPPQAITEIYAIAADVGMPTHEIENLIEWEINPFTPEERTVLKKYIGITALIVHHKDNINRYGHMQQDIVNEYCCAMANRHRAFLLDTPLAFARMNWQNSAKSYFVSGLTNAFSHYLLENPVKIPSGKYVETLKVERTQQDLNNEMVSELVSLPRFQAYVKLIQETDGRQSVATHKIETHPLPEKPESDIETLVTQSGYDFCKKREDIEAEIRERQNRWGRGGSPPPTRRLRD